MLPMNITETSRIHWACRRGMLELDELLEFFFLNRYASLSPADQQTFIDLLDCADQDLFNWLLGDQEPGNPVFQKLCHAIQDAYRQA